MAIKILASVLLIFFLIQKLDSKKVFSYLLQANLFYLLLALLSFVISKVISAYRLNLFYKAKKLILPTSLNIKLYLLAMYYSLFVPGIGGDGFKIFWLNQKYGFEVKKAIWTSLIDRASGLIALLFLMIIFFWFSKFVIPFKGITWICIPLMYFTFYFILRFFFQDFLPVFIKTNIQSITVQLLQVLCIWFIIRAMNIEALGNEYIFVFLFSSLAFIIPLLGFREMAFILGAKWLGLDPELSAAISVLFYLCIATTSLSGIYYFFLPQKLNPEKGSYQKPI